jgi:hypothetical protein
MTAVSAKHTVVQNNTIGLCDLRCLSFAQSIYISIYQSIYLSVSLSATVPPELGGLAYGDPEGSQRRNYSWESA